MVDKESSLNLTIPKTDLENTVAEEFNLRTTVGDKIVWTFMLPGKVHYFETKVYSNNAAWDAGLCINHPGFIPEYQQNYKCSAEAIEGHFGTVDKLKRTKPSQSQH
jgi:hypothetical protein